MDRVEHTVEVCRLGAVRQPPSGGGPVRGGRGEKRSRKPIGTVPPWTRAAVQPGSPLSQGSGKGRMPLGAVRNKRRRRR